MPQRVGKKTFTTMFGFVFSVLLRYSSCLNICHDKLWIKNGKTRCRGRTRWRETRCRGNEGGKRNIKKISSIAVHNLKKIADENVL